MLYEERLEAAERLRLAGNALFTTGDATGAMGKCALPAQAADGSGVQGFKEEETRPL